MGRITHELLRTEFPEPLERIVERLHRDNRWAGELVHRRKNGTQIVVASRWALDKDEEGNRKCILETNNDITEQKQNDKALREARSACARYPIVLKFKCVCGPRSWSGEMWKSSSSPSSS